MLDNGIYPEKGGRSLSTVSCAVPNEESGISRMSIIGELEIDSPMDTLFPSEPSSPRLSSDLSDYRRGSILVPEDSHGSILVSDDDKSDCGENVEMEVFSAAPTVNMIQPKVGQGLASSPSSSL